jgi:sugar lactone lactonase YvrE
MQGTTKGRTPVAVIFRRAAVLPLVVFALVASLAGPAVARPDKVIVLPGATSAEGIAAGRGATFFAGDLFAGDIFRGNVRRGTAELFIDAPAGRMAVGMSADTRHDLLFVAGGGGFAYVYNTRTKAPVASYQVGDAATSFVNDVIVTRRGAWFTDSLRPTLFFVPVSRHGTPGAIRELALSGPAADLTGDFNLNGIEATPDGKTLLVAHSANNQIYTVNPATGASAPIAGANPTGPDGIVLDRGRLWVVGNNQVTRFRVNRSLTSAVVEKVITSDLFQTPSTAALFGDRLAVINAKFDTGIPPTADQYEAIIVNA